MVITGFGFALLGFVFIGIPLLVFVFRYLSGVTKRQRRRECPQCGAFVKRGRTTCSTCSFDFAPAAKP
jgi:hypothetical protein